MAWQLAEGTGESGCEQRIAQWLVEASSPPEMATPQAAERDYAVTQGSAKF